MLLLLGILAFLSFVSCSSLYPTLCLSFWLIAFFQSPCISCSSDPHVKTGCSLSRSWLSHDTTSTCSRLSVGNLVFSIFSSRSHRTDCLLFVLYVLMTGIFRVSSAVKNTDGPNIDTSTYYLTALSSHNHIKICTHDFTPSTSYSLILISPVTASPVSQAISLIDIKKKKDVLKGAVVGVIGRVVVEFISSFITGAIYGYRKVTYKL